MKESESAPIPRSFSRAYAVWHIILLAHVLLGFVYATFSY